MNASAYWGRRGWPRPQLRGRGFIFGGMFALITVIGAAGFVVCLIDGRLGDSFAFLCIAIVSPALFLLISASYLRRLRTEAGPGDVILFTAAAFVPANPDIPISALARGWLRLDEQTLEVWETRRPRPRATSSVLDVISVTKVDYLGDVSEPLLRIVFRDGSTFEGVMSHDGMRGVFGLFQADTDAWRRRLESRIAPKTRGA